MPVLIPFCENSIQVFYRLKNVVSRICGFNIIPAELMQHRLEFLEQRYHVLIYFTILTQNVFCCVEEAACNLVSYVL